MSKRTPRPSRYWNDPPPVPGPRPGDMFERNSKGTMQPYRDRTLLLLSLLAASGDRSPSKLCMRFIGFVVAKYAGEEGYLATAEDGALALGAHAGSVQRAAAEAVETGWLLVLQQGGGPGKATIYMPNALMVPSAKPFDTAILEHMASRKPNETVGHNSPLTKSG